MTDITQLIMKDLANRDGCKAYFHSTNYRIKKKLVYLTETFDDQGKST